MGHLGFVHNCPIWCGTLPAFLSSLAPRGTGNSSQFVTNRCWAVKKYCWCHAAGLLRVLPAKSFLAQQMLSYTTHIAGGGRWCPKPTPRVCWQSYWVDWVLQDVPSNFLISLYRRIWTLLASAWLGGHRHSLEFTVKKPRQRVIKKFAGGCTGDSQRWLLGMKSLLGERSLFNSAQFRCTGLLV